MNIVRTIKICLLVFSFASHAAISKAQVYLDPKASVEDRVNDLVPRLTSEEKLSYIGGLNNFYIRGISRLSIPEIKMSDGPVGVRTFGKTTAYPAGTLTAATWDTTLVGELGRALGKDARSRGVHILLAPGMNIYRAPMCGRNFEYFGEDPYLASRMAVDYIEGVQREGVVATAKHFAANNQEWDRYNVSSDIDERTLQEIYLPAFKAAVTEANVGSVMSSYNLVNGIWASENHYLLTDILKNDWNFSGFVMSDWGATHSGKNSALAGLDLEMPSGANMNSTNLSPLISNGTVPQSVIDDKVRRILRVIIRFGFLDRPQLDSSIPNDYAPNAQVALNVARGGIVLLKNKNSVLPLDKTSIKSIAVIGSNANSWVTGGGSSYTDPFHYVSTLDGIKSAAGNDISVSYNAGTGGETNTYTNSVFYTDNSLSVSGLTGSYFSNKTLSGIAMKTQVDQHINFSWGSNAPGVSGIPADNFSVRWTGVIKVPATGNYTFYLRSDDGSRLLIDNVELISQWNDQAATTKSAIIHLTKDQLYNIRLEYYEAAADAEIKMGYQLLDFDNSPAVLAAKNADAAVVCVGFNSNSESEGFDRPFQLPDLQDSLINAVARVNPKTIVILNAGGNVATESWITNAGALLHAWYAGQEGGTAIGEILFGLTNPSGKLPVSLEKKWEDNPVFNSYYDPDGDKHVAYTEGLMVGYRYYDTKNVEPLFPFGFGLSYTTFDYSNLKISPSTTDNPNSVEVSFDLTNTGGMAGSEVAQLYIHQNISSVIRPEKELKGFSKIYLNPGETQTVSMKLDSTSFSYFKTDKNAFGYDPGIFEIRIGASSKDIRLNGTLTLRSQDNINPEIVSLTPANNSTTAEALNTFAITFSEPVYYDFNKTIRLKQYATNQLIETIDSAAFSGMGTKTLTFTNATALKNSYRYYIEFDQGTFVDLNDNPCQAIYDKNEWNFVVNATGLEQLSDSDSELKIYPNPANNHIIMENFSSGAMPLKVVLLDVTGQNIDSFILPENQPDYEYNSASLTPGIYFVRYFSPSGWKVKKLVKK
ncbi:MAG: glycoside hydrolase family 3 C-terminal domain-containing protein [Prolixibacteraceae bacterium]|jgi:beta-glucosidase